MTIFMFANNVDTTLAGAISPSATSLTLSSAANLPASIPVGSVLVITLNDRATEQNFEVIYATSVTGATLSGLLRGQEGTSALSWLTNDYAYSPPTAGELGSFGQLAANNTWAGNNEWTGQNRFTQNLPIGFPLNAPDAVNLGQFLASLGSNGYFEFPVLASGVKRTVIVQWGGGSILSTGTGVSNQDFSLPIPYPNANLWVLANFGGTSPPSGDSCAGSPSGLSAARISIYTQGPGTYAVNYIAIGY